MGPTRTFTALVAALLGATWPGLAYQVGLHPAATVFDANPAVLDANLGFPPRNLVVEVFEDAALIPELKANVTGHPAGEADAAAAAWDGQWPSSSSAGETRFEIRMAGVRVFGVGVSGNDCGGNEELSINEGKPLLLNELPGHRLSPERAFYLKIQAEAGDPDIQGVRISNAANLRFDHLVLQRSDDPTRGPSAPVAAAPDTLAVTKGSDPAKPLHAMLQERLALTDELEWDSGVALLSKSGRRYLGHQTRLFHLDPDGVLSAPEPRWLSLYYTEGKPFRLSGQVWLGGASEARLVAEGLPDGFALFIREWDGLQRYALTSREITVKRRRHRGQPVADLVTVAEWQEPPRSQWIPFYLDVNWDRIVFCFGSQAAVIQGPLDVDGANKIAIAPGTRLRQLRLELSDVP